MNRTPISILAIAIAFTAIFIAGCCGTTSSTTSYATPATTPNGVSSTGTAGTSAPVATSTTVSNTGQFASATTLYVWTYGKNWDADAENDGLEVQAFLKDAKDEIVTWRGVTVPVEVEIWTKKMDENYKTQKDKLVYKGSGTLDDWDGAIRVPYDQMTVPSGELFGLTYVTMHTPDGKTYEGVWDATSFNP